ncbi:hypothetical protein Pmani_032946 [Petrolisthes manimaculis]|uniref:Uncharacterized protein n=1 Tax=Petrolisthes manimaculis TaxID=1843537 RepID=A0AAE1NST5_9EUCA|nr:hypothetical protein Pmani_032946 [Petrolisthes manimaculis]
MCCHGYISTRLREGGEGMWRGGDVVFGGAGWNGEMECGEEMVLVVGMEGVEEEMVLVVGMEGWKVKN